jgi:hypothetical protein
MNNPHKAAETGSGSRVNTANGGDAAEFETNAHDSYDEILRKMEQLGYCDCALDI